MFENDFELSERDPFLFSSLQFRAAKFDPRGSGGGPYLTSIWEIAARFKKDEPIISLGRPSTRQGGGKKEGTRGAREGEK